MPKIGKEIIVKVKIKSKWNTVWTDHDHIGRLIEELMKAEIEEIRIIKERRWLS